MSERWGQEKSIENQEFDPAVGSGLAEANDGVRAMDSAIAEGPRRLTDVVGRTVTALKKRGMRAGEILTLLTSVGLGACATAHGEDLQIHGSDGYKASTQMVERRSSLDLVEAPTLALPAVERQEDEAKLRAELIEATGIDVWKIAKDAGFKVRFQVRNGKGNYVFKADQWHKRSKGDGEDGPNAIRQVLSSQGGLTGLYDGFVATGEVKDMFPEAVSELNVKDYEVMMNNHKYLAEQPDDSYGFERFERQVRLAYAPKFLDSRLIDGHLYTARYERFKSAAQRDPDLAAALAKAQPTIEPLLTDGVRRFGPQARLMAGADDAAVMDGKFTVHASEIQAVNDAAMRARLAKNASYEKNMTADPDKLTNEEAGVRLKEYEAAQAEEYKAVNTDRENAFFQQVNVAVRGQRVRGRLFLASWGAAHNFGPAAELWNNTHTDAGDKVGVIWLTPEKVP